ncbi:hypothetical protein [Parapedobacter indicus]|uniref:Lipoprotein n=1 Tax=Parapedobacter indicus TaxID=1477437 RepID=A0A1I3IKH3_9SPHI|nr:hypothetical protein [Parapedobacter indicus]PPL02207.1 hypothetical protein CLV26_104132 [Parapedobacter indicus]SFI48498.1 hypothetical protein SAMN05444682_104132 [Parapedobacter indicus]
MKSIAYILLTFIAAALSCDKTESTRDCGSVACTEVFMSVGVKVTDTEGNPVALDRIQITRLPDNEDFTREYDDETWDIFTQQGSYPIADDSDGNRLPLHTDIKLNFRGYIGSREVVNADYVVAFDCCHISLVSGNTELVVE